MTQETETERLSRECREMYEELSAQGLIEGSYEDWLKHATQSALAGRLNGHEEKPAIILPAGRA